MNVFQSWQIILQGTILQLVPAIGLSLALAFFAWGLRAVTAAAALAGVFLTVILCLAAGNAALLPVAAVFLLTVISTRIGRRKKERLGTAERRRGRGARQIFANLSVAALCAAPLIFLAHPRYILLAGASAALAEAAGDTVSSELGQTFGQRPRLITTLRASPPARTAASPSPEPCSPSPPPPSSAPPASGPISCSPASTPRCSARPSSEPWSTACSAPP